MYSQLQRQLQSNTACQYCSAQTVGCVLSVDRVQNNLFNLGGWSWLQTAQSYVPSTSLREAAIPFLPYAKKGIPVICLSAPSLICQIFHGSIYAILLKTPL